VGDFWFATAPCLKGSTVLDISMRRSVLNVVSTVKCHIRFGWICSSAWLCCSVVEWEVLCVAALYLPLNKDVEHLGSHILRHYLCGGSLY
jgi:hypothetical protein